MARIRDLLDPEVRESAYALKDTLKSERTLEADYLRMNRTQFTRYLRAKMASVIQEQTNRGASMEMAYHKAKIVGQFCDGQWRREAKRLNEASHGS